MKRIAMRKKSIILVILAAVLGAAFGAGILFHALGGKLFARADDGEKLVDITLEADEAKYELNGNYYREKSAVSNPYYAFTQGMTAQEVQARLQVTLHYENEEKGTTSSKVVKWNAEGYAMSFSNAPSFGSADSAADNLPVEIKFTVTENDTLLTVGENTTEFSETLHFYKREIGGLAVKDWTSPTDMKLTSSVNFSTLNLLNKVYPVYNNGLFVENSTALNSLDLSTANLSFMPSSAGFAQIVGQIAAGKQSNEVTYSKTLEIPASDSYKAANNPNIQPLSVTVENIQYEAPLALFGSINGTSLGEGTVNQAFDYTKGNATVMFNFNEIGLAQVNLSDLISACTVTMTDNEGNPYSSLSRSITKITISFDPTKIGLAGAAVTREFNNNQFVINPAAINAPVLQDFFLEYREDECFTTLAGIESGMSIRVVENTFTSDSSSDENGIDEDSVTEVSAERALASADGKVEFFCGGTFYVLVSMEPTGDHYFSSTNQTVERRGVYWLLFKIQVDKAPVEVTLNDYAPSREYGDSEPAFSVSGTVTGYDSMGFNSATDAVNRIPHGQSVPADEAESLALPSYQLFYFWGTMTKENATTAVPTALGTYHVFARTTETARYLSGESEPVAFEIVTRKLDLSKVPTEATYKGEEFDVEDIVSYSRDDGKPVLAYDDKIGEVITISAGGAILHADTYEITVNTTTDKGANYELVNGTEPFANPLSFTVNKLTVSFAVTQFKNSFAFGDDAAGNGVKDQTVAFDKRGLGILYKENNGNSGFHYVDVNTANAKYYRKNQDGTKGAEVTSDAFPWEVGDYIAEYSVTNLNNANCVPADYTCENVEKEFTITPLSVDKVTLSAGSVAWGSDGQFKAIGTYAGSAISSAFANWTSDKASDNTAILTATVAGMRFDDTTGITEGITNAQDGTILLTEAGNYTVTVTLNANYVWMETGTNEQLAFSGKIEKQTLSGLTFDRTEVTYNAEAQSVQVWFCAGDGAAGWTPNILAFDSITGSEYAAASASVTGSNETGMFGVTYAGNYAVSMKFASEEAGFNYAWGESEPTSVTFTVKQKELGASWTWADGSHRFNPDAEELIQETPSVELVAVNETDKAKIAFTTKLYTTYDGEAFSGGLENVTASGTYYMVITAVSGTADDGTTYLNYRLPVLYKEFTIDPATLTPVTLTAGGKTASFVYDGKEHKFSEFLSNKGEYITSTGTYYIDIAIEGLEGNDPAVKNVNGYSVTVKPAKSYEWSTDGTGVTANEELTFTLEITPYELTVNWTNAKLCDSGATDENSVYSGNEKEVTGVAADTRENDEITLSFTYAVNGVGQLQNGKPLNAGVYTVTARIEGEEQNYTLKNDLTHEFTVYKQGIAKPSLASNHSATYNAENKTVANLYANGNELYVTLLTASVTGYLPGEWFGSEEENVALTLAAGDKFNEADGTLIYTNAGHYLVSFVLNGTNYCWADEFDTAKANFDHNSYSYEWDKETPIEINRASLTAPILGKYRAMEWDKGVAVLKETVFTAEKVPVPYTVRYGTVDLENNLYLNDLEDDQKGGTGEKENVTRGEYYALLALGEVDRFNYTWSFNTSDTEGTSFVSRLYEIVFTKEGGAQIYLNYAVTASQLEIYYKVVKDEYVFGENFGFIGANANDTQIGIADVVQIDTDHTSASNVSIVQRPDVRIGYTFRKNEPAGQTLGDADLFNGLPKERGVYYVTVTVDFSQSTLKETYSTLNITTNAAKEWLKITVTQRAIEVAWVYADGAVEGTTITATYNGKAQKPTAVITNMPGTDAPVSEENLPTLEYTYSGDCVNAGGYNLAVATVNDNNLTVGTHASVNATLSIGKKALTASGVAVAEHHIYGDSYNGYDEITNATEDYTKYFNVDGLVDEDLAKAIVKFEIRDDAGNKIVSNLADAKTYNIVPVLLNENGNYTLTVSENGTLTVDKRQITVTIKDGVATSVYGEEPHDLNSDAYYTVVRTDDGTKQAIPAGVTDVKTVFTLRVLDKDNTEKQIDNLSNAGKHEIVIDKVGEANYEITYETVYYEITAAEIAITAVEGYTGTYDANDHPLFNALDAKTQNDMTVVWYVGTRTDEASEIVWRETPYDSKADVICNVADSKTYYVKATAENHKERVYRGDSGEIGVDVTVEKAKIVISVNLAIFYGENSPLDYDGSNTLYKGALNDLRDENGIYAIDANNTFKSAQDRVDFYDGTKEFVTGAFSYAFKEGFVYEKGDGVSQTAYILVFKPETLESANYCYEGAESYLIVKPLPVTMTVEDLTATYGTSPKTPEVELSTVTAEQTSSYEGVEGTIDIFDKNIRNIVTVTTKAITENNETANVGTYDITLTLNDNYTWQGAEGKGTYEITRAQNGIVTFDGSDYRLFVTKDVTWKAGGDRAANPAWIYGGYSSSDNALQSFTMRDRSEELQFTLKRGETTLATGTAQSQEGAANMLQKLFDTAYAALGDMSFLAGEYTVTFEMAQTTNYVAFQEEWCFEVGKATLTVTIGALSVEYGAEIPTYASSVSGLTTSTQGGTADKLEDVIAFTLSSSYQKGYENGSVGTYLISETVTGLTKNAEGKYEAANYIVTFIENYLTVTPRALTIDVADAKNFYDFLVYDTDKMQYVRQETALLQATLTGGEFADGDTMENVFAFYTEAVLSLSDRTTTNNAGTYAICLKGNTHYAKEGNNNYTVIVNGSWTDALPEGALGGGAGTYTIDPAEILVDMEIPENLVYDGTVKEYSVNVSGGLPAGTSVVFEAKYYSLNGQEETALDGAPKNVGSYRVDFQPQDGNNYKTSVPSQSYRITKRTITVSAAVANESGINGKTENGKLVGYYFNGGDFSNTLTFDGIVEGENLVLTENVTLRVTEGQKAGLNVQDFMWSSWLLQGGAGTFTVRNAGVYTVTLTLDSNDTFKANNYQIRVGNTDGDSYSFELNILLATLRVSTEEASVQYGTQSLEQNVFNPVWEVYLGDSRLSDERTEALLSTEDGKMYSGGKAYLDRTHYTFGSTYSVRTSAWEGKYDLYLNVNSVEACNFAVERGDIENKLTLTAREVRVKVLGYGEGDSELNKLVSFEYAGQHAMHAETLNANLRANRTKFLTVTQNGITGTVPSDYSDPVNGVTLLAERGLNVGDYKFAPMQNGGPMYKITFVNAHNVTIDANDLNGAREKLPVWQITPATLTLRVGAYRGNVTFESLDRNVSVSYGFGLSFAIAGNQTFAIRYSGWKNGEGNEAGNINAENNHVPVTEFTVVKENGENVVYAPWDSQAFERYSVRPALGTFEYKNYVIKVEEATLTIEQLEIRAQTIAATYTEKGNDGAIDYNGGISGIEHDVQLSYTYGDSIALPVGTTSGTAKAPLFGATYQENGASLATAPTMAGNYKATVTLAQNGNYKFANGYTATLDYEVKKQSIEISWDSVNKVLGDQGVTSATATVAAFRNEIMDVVVFNHDDTPLTESDYAADKNELSIVVDKTGRYIVTFKFNDNALRNYEWVEGEGNFKTISFTVTTSDKQVFLTVTIDDMTYGEMPSEPSYTLKNFNGNEIAGAAIAYTYATVDESGKTGTFTSAFPQNAGKYVVRAYYAGGTTNEYAAAEATDEFEIFKATVTVPVFTQKDTTYTGNSLSATVEYDTLHVYIVPSGIDYTTTATGAVLRRTNANTYSITFALRSDRNHVWDSAIKEMEDIDILEEDGVITRVTLTWIVEAAQDNLIEWNGADISVVYGEDYDLNADSKYHGSVTLYAVSKGDYENAEAVPSGAWTEYAAEDFQNVGEYFIRAWCEGNSNYNDAVAYKSLTITKATLTVTAHGSLVYEQKFAQGTFGYTVQGFVNGDDEGDLTVGDIEYLLVDATLEKDALDAREYALTMALENGAVKGLFNPNYNIVMASESGTFTVEKRAITILIGNAEGVYNETPDSSAVSLRASAGWTAPADVDLKTYLGTQAVINATKESNVGTYSISATACTNQNYNVTFVDGTYTIVALRVRLEIEAGGGVYGGTIVGAKVLHVYTVNAQTQTDLGADTFIFNYRYTGTANDGTAYNSEQCPTKAGNYLATVTGMVAGDNYALDLTAGDVSVAFVIAKAELDPNKIAVGEQEFTNQPLLPVITSDDYKDFYTVEEITEEFVNVGTHYFTVTLKDFNNYKWTGIDVRTAQLRFVITKASNRLVSETPGEEPTIHITDWVFGQFSLDNMPSAHVEFGDRSIIYMYATSENGEYTTGIPANGDAGDYWVRVTVLETDNYKRFDSAPVKFRILPYALTAPALSVTQTTFTGSDIPSEVLGYDDVRMGISYQDGTIDMNGNAVTVYARNAGDYTVKVSIKNTTNYCWAEGTETDENGNALLSWTVAKQKVALPTDNDKALIVNGSLLEYFPVGFLPEIMDIEGNQSAYGGEFKAYVSLKDTDNYEWADGSIGKKEFTFTIVGANTIFLVTVSGLSVLIVVAGGFAIAQYAVFRRRKVAGENVKEQASAEQEENKGGEEE